MATTISISNELKEDIRNLGRAGDSYEDVIRKMYDLTKKQMITAYLYDTSDSFSKEEVEKRLNA